MPNDKKKLCPYLVLSGVLILLAGIFVVWTLFYGFPGKTPEEPVNERFEIRSIAD